MKDLFVATFFACMVTSVQALTLAQIQSYRNNGTLLEVHVSGSSSLSAMVGVLFADNCEAGTLDIYRSDKTDSAFWGDTVDGQSVNAYTCTLKGFNNRFGAWFNNKHILFQKSDRGGSGSGVFPVALNQPLPYLRVVNNSNCIADICKSNGLTVHPDGGVSDVAPVGFNPPLNRPRAGIGNPEWPVDYSAFPNLRISDFQTVLSVIQTVYGLAVSQPLYAALQAEQGLGAGVRPSVPKAVIASMLSNSYDIGLGWTPLLPTNANNFSQINICRYLNGFGAQIAANRFFHEYGANASSLTPADNANNSDNPGVNRTSEISTAGAYVVYEGSNTSNVRNCLIRARDVNAFAIGHVSLENPETVAWKFVKIDGVEPTRDNAKKGLYEYVFESTFQVNKAADIAQQTFIRAFASAAGSAHYLNALPLAMQAGVLALPYSPSCPATFGTSVGAPDKFCSRMYRPYPANQYMVYK